MNDPTTTISILLYLLAETVLVAVIWAVLLWGYLRLVEPDVETRMQETGGLYLSHSHAQGRCLAQTARQTLV